MVLCSGTGHTLCVSLFERFPDAHSQFPYDSTMAVDAAATTSAEAAHYRAAGWWSDTTLSDCVAENAATSPDKPAYVDFSLNSVDQVLTWSQFDNAATNLAVRLRDLGVGRGDRVAIWHGDTAAIHVLLVAIERCGAVTVGLGARAGVREAAHILRTTQTHVTSSATPHADTRGGHRRRRG